MPPTKGATEIPSSQPAYLSQSQTLLFKFDISTALFVNYFDSHSNLWEPFLLKPWELHFHGSRTEDTASPPKRCSTFFDIKSHPCHVSFSEQLLVSLGGARRMWSVYSDATEKAKDLVSRK
eukprot:33388-Ditylum_brightwellii.AAC.1